MNTKKYMQYVQRLGTNEAPSAFAPPEKDCLRVEYHKF